MKQTASTTTSSKICGFITTGGSVFCAGSSTERHIEVVMKRSSMEFHSPRGSWKMEEGRANG
jgi:hypothetical protein